MRSKILKFFLKFNVTICLAVLTGFMIAIINNGTKQMESFFNLPKYISLFLFSYSLFCAYYPISKINLLWDKFVDKTFQYFEDFLLLYPIIQVYKTYMVQLHEYDIYRIKNAIENAEKYLMKGKMSECVHTMDWIQNELKDFIDDQKINKNLER